MQTQFWVSAWVCVFPIRKHVKIHRHIVPIQNDSLTHNSNKNPFSRFETIIFGQAQNDILKLNILKLWNGGTYGIPFKFSINLTRKYTHKHKRIHTTFSLYEYIFTKVPKKRPKEEKCCNIWRVHDSTHKMFMIYVYENEMKKCLACGSQSVSVQKQYTMRKTTAAAATEKYNNNRWFTQI